MSLKDQITEDMKSAMRAKEAAKLGTIRLITAAMKQKEVDERVDLTDAMVLAIIEKMIKQRKDSIAQFEAGGRQDLADIEKAELLILSAYMPAGLSDAEIQAAVASAVALSWAVEELVEASAADAAGSAAAPGDASAVAGDAGAPDRDGSAGD